MKRLLFLGLLFTSSCSHLIFHPTLRVGMDPNWFYTNVGKQAFAINGFIQEILLEISNETGIQFELYEENWDNLFQKLNRKEYDFVVSGLQPEGMAKELYFFSNPILKTGPILVTKKNSKIDSLMDLDHKNISYVEGSFAFMLLQAYPQIQLMPEPSIPLALNRLMMDKCTASLVDALVAYRYVEDLYEDSLQIKGEPLGNQGIRWICLPQKHSDTCKLIQKAMNRLKKTEVFQKIFKKWGLR